MRREKIGRMVDYVKKMYNFEVPLKDILEIEKRTQSFGKPHIYQIMCKYGDFDRKEFYRIMQDLNTQDLKLDALKVLKLAHNGKGYVTLAHPREIMDEYNFTYSQIDEIVAYLCKFGLDALETEHSKHTLKDIEEFKKIAIKHNLKQTCGSDYHGPNIKPNVKLGVCVKL